MPNVLEIGNAPGSIASTQTLLIDQVLRGQLATLTDVDYYKVNLVAHKNYIGALVGTGLNPVSDTYLELYDSAGALVVNVDDGLPNTNSLLSFSVATSGTYFLAAQSFGSLSRGQYGLSFTTQSKAIFDEDMAAGVINTGTSWATGHAMPATVSYGFRSTGPTYTVDGSDLTTFTTLTKVEQTAVRQILAHFSEVCGLTFTDANVNGLTNNAAVLFGNYTDPYDGAGAFAFSPGPPTSADPAGDVWLNTDSVSTTSISPGDYSYATLLHEIGHAVGLSHPGVYNAAPNVSITYLNDAQFFHDSEQYSVMSYFDASETGAVVPGKPVTLMLSDIEALQNIYGANATTRNGDTVYGFNSTAGGIYDFDANGLSALCIWDGGGNDTLDLSGFKQNQKISIAGGGFSSVGNFTDCLSIALRAVIENAIGGSGNDEISGGDVANHLFGQGGNDTLAGGLGADVLDGGKGVDAADYRLSTGSNVNVNLLAGTATGGHAAGDTFVSIENLLGSLTQQDILTGDNHNNAIYGNGGNDVLFGQGGNDYIVGGAGADSIDGGAGLYDWASYVTNAVGQINVNLLANTATGGDATGDTLIGIENLEGSLNMRSILIGSNSANILVGHNRNDTIRGEAGNDKIEGGGGADSLNGGAGIDTVSYKHSTAGVTVDLKLTKQVSTGDAAGDSLYLFENITGSNQADTLTGNKLANRLSGGLGADKLDGGTGSDDLAGGAGDDTFRFQDASFGTDHILDWQDGIDKISISLLLDSSFSGLCLTDNGTTSVTVRGFDSSATIVVQCTTAFTLDASDFIFI